jgi:hypothetical protein
MMIIWKSSKCSGAVIFQNAYAMSVEFSSIMSDVQWVLTNVYAPCTPEGREEFLDWFHDIDMAVTIDWLIVGDFNLIRRSSAETILVGIFKTCLSSMLQSAI